MISARKENGKVKSITIVSEKGGELRIKNEFENFHAGKTTYQLVNGAIVMKTQPGQKITITSTGK